jgi:hypothetical protein
MQQPGEGGEPSLIYPRKQAPGCPGAGGMGSLVDKLPRGQALVFATIICSTQISICSDPFASREQNNKPSRCQ